MATDKLMDVEIVTPHSVVFSGKAVSVSIPGSQSPFQVLYNHAPIVSSLDIGIVKIVDGSGNKAYYAIGSGFAEVRKNQISILVEIASTPSELDSNLLNSEIIKMKEKIHNTKDNQEKNELKNDLKVLENNLKVAEKK